MTTPDFISILHTDRPDQDRAEKMQLYGQFVGDWDAKVIRHGESGDRHEADGEIHFGWVLQGRAVQDVWITPPLQQRGNAAALPGGRNWYGSTVRVYDPELDAWRIWWINPAGNSFRQQIGRPRGKDIVQEGRTDEGVLTRWSFTRIRPDSFHWLGEASTNGGVSWQLPVEVLARRRAA